MPTPLVTIGVLLTRGPDMVGRCLRAVAATREGAPESELVLVLATGDPATAEVVRSEAPDASVIRAPVGLNVGLGPAQNLIFATARGRRILLLHEDSYPEPGALAELWAAAEARPKAAVVGSWVSGRACCLPSSQPPRRKSSFPVSWLAVCGGTPRQRAAARAHRPDRPRGRGSRA